MNQCIVERIASPCMEKMGDFLSKTQWPWEMIRIKWVFLGNKSFQYQKEFFFLFCN